MSIELKISLVILLIVLAGAFKATADTVADHYYTSIFKNMNPKFWDKTTASQYAKFLPYTKFRWDAWHISNTLMIWSFIGIGSILLPLAWYWGLASFIVFGMIFILDFNLLYDRIYKSKS